MALRLCKASYLAQRILRPRDALPVRGGAFNPVALGKPVSEPVRTRYIVAHCCQCVRNT